MGRTSYWRGKVRDFRVPNFEGFFGKGESPARLLMFQFMRLALCWPFYSGKGEDADKEKPPKIFTNRYWPVKQRILSNLSFSDKRALAQAFPGLEIQEDVSYKRQERHELLNKVEIIIVPTTSYCKW